MTKAGPDYITDILWHTKSCDFIRTASDMQGTLTMYRHDKLYIKKGYRDQIFAYHPELWDTRMSI